MRRQVLRPEERMPKLVGWVAAVLWLFYLAWSGRSDPWGWLLYCGLLVAEPSGSAVADAWLGVSVHFVTLSVALLGAAATLWLQRGQEDRFEPLAVLAITLGVVGQSATIAALQWTTTYVEHPALGLLRCGEGLLAGAVLCGLAALPRLAMHRTRRGFGMAIGAAGVCAGALFYVEGAFLHPPVAPEPADGVELGEVDYAPVRNGNHPEEFRPVASLRADGSVVIHGVELASGDRKAWGAQLREVASEMETRDGFPDEPLAIRVDRRAPMRELVSLARLAAEAGIWKQQLEVARPAAWLPFLRRGVVFLFWPLDPVGGTDELGGQVEPEQLLRIRSSPSGDAHYEYAGEVVDEAVALRPVYAEHSDSGLFVEVDGELPWSVVAAAFDAPEFQRHELVLLGLRLAE